MRICLIAPLRPEFCAMRDLLIRWRGRDSVVWYSGVFHSLERHLGENQVYMYRVDPRKQNDDFKIEKVDLSTIDIAIIDQSADRNVASMLDFFGSARPSAIVEGFTRKGIVCIGVSRDGQFLRELEDAGALLTASHEGLELRLDSGLLREARRLVRENRDDETLKALSLRQPHAAAIFICGKDIENRAWPARVRGTIAIHVVQEQTRKSYDAGATFVRGILRAKEMKRIRIPPYGELPMGSIIGLVDIVECVEDSQSDWFEGPIGYLLANPRVLHQPIPCKGKRRFWRVPKSVEGKIRKQLADQEFIV